MNGNEIEKRIEQLGGYSTALIAAIRVMDQGRYILLPLLEDEALKDTLAVRLKNTHGAYAYNHLVPILAHDLIRDCSRIFLDAGDKACSLCNLHRKAASNDVLDVLRSKFRNIPDQFSEVRIYDLKLTEDDQKKYFANMREDQKNRYEEDFKSAWADLSAFVSGLEKNETALKIKTFRDKYFAHLEMQPLNQEPAPYNVENLGLKFNDVFAFMDECIKCCVNLVRLITGTTHVVGSFAEVHKKRGASMWTVLINGGK